VPDDVELLTATSLALTYEKSLKPGLSEQEKKKVIKHSTNSTALLPWHLPLELCSSIACACM